MLGAPRNSAGPGRIVPGSPGPLRLDERFLDVADDPPGSVDPVRNRENFVRVKERAEHEHRALVALFGPRLSGSVEGRPDLLSRPPQDMQGVVDSRS